LTLEPLRKIFAGTGVDRAVKRGLAA